MAMYYDSPEDAIQDDFDELVFPNHALGGNILGTIETVGSFRREDLQQFIADNYDTSRIVFASVSKLPFKQVVKVAEKYFRDIPAQHSTRREKRPQITCPGKRG